MDQTPDTATPAAAIEPAPAPAVAATETPRTRPGFIARMLGDSERVAELESALATEQAAHATTRAALESAQARVSEFEALEAQLEERARAAETAASTAQAAAEEFPQQVSAQVAAVVESLGVPEATLPAAQANPPEKGQDFAHLKGVDRAAAAINAKFGI